MSEPGYTVSTVTKLRAAKLRNGSIAGRRKRYLQTSLTVGCTQPTLQWVTTNHSLRQSVKLTTLFRAKFKNDRSHTSTPLCAHIQCTGTNSPLTTFQYMHQTRNHPLVSEGKTWIRNEALLSVATHEITYQSDRCRFRQWSAEATFI
jgi:hypothetical protein